MCTPIYGDSNYTCCPSTCLTYCCHWYSCSTTAKALIGYGHQVIVSSTLYVPNIGVHAVLTVR